MFVMFKWYKLLHYKEIPPIYWMTLVDEACILNGVLHVIEKTKCISFRKQNSLKDRQGSVLKYFPKPAGT